MRKLKTAAKVNMEKFPVHKRIALGDKPKGPIAAKGANQPSSRKK